MINFENCLLKILKFFEKTNANNKKSTKIFVSKILHLKPINNKKQVVKQNTEKFKFEGNTQTPDVKEIENETEGDDDDDGGGGFNDDGDDDNDNDDNGDVEIDDDDRNSDNDDDGYSGDDDSNLVNGVTGNEDVSNIKHLIGET